MTTWFIAIEGLDGSGKTTLIQPFAAHFSRAFEGEIGVFEPSSVLVTYEPQNDYAAGAYIRQVLAREVPATPYMLALAYALNRLDHNARLIGPFLAGATPTAPRVVLSDRYYLSSLAYQATDEQPIEAVMQLNRQARRPDLHLFLDVDAETSRARIGLRGKSAELFDERLAEMRDRYLAAIAYLRGQGEPVAIVDARGPREQVLAAAAQAVADAAPSWLADRLRAYPPAAGV